MNELIQWTEIFCVKEPRFVGDVHFTPIRELVTGNLAEEIKYLLN